MKRRNFITTATLSGLGLMFCSFSPDAERKKAKKVRSFFSMNRNRASIFTHAKITPTRIFHITDTHLSLDDQRGVPFQKYSSRMAATNKSKIHFQTGEELTTTESFEYTLELAKGQAVDFLLLTGDIFSFPSEAAIEWVLQKLNKTGIPFAYIAGNHDWHYEGMKGSSRQLRDTWTNKRLKPLYQGNHALYAAYHFNGIRFVCIDNSTYEILPEQLDFFRDQVNSGIPLILAMHIPLHIPGRRGFGCGHPEWGAKSDRGYKVERREKWRAGGHTKVTMNFVEEVFMAPNLLATMAGHTHRSSLDVKNNIPQIVSELNATGYYTDLHVATLT